MAHLALGEAILPIGIYGLFLTGIFSVVMSTLDSDMFISGVTLGPDMLGRVPAVSMLGEPALTRIGMALVTVVSVAFAVFVPSVVDMYYTIGTLAVPGLLLPVLSSVGIVPRIPSKWVAAHLLAVPAVSIVWYLFGYYSPGTLPHIEPFYPGCAASVLLWSCGLLAPGRN